MARSTRNEGGSCSKMFQSSRAGAARFTRKRRPGNARDSIGALF